ncbi:MAG: Asp-tRNA(Asn)/Glu-tRNA(Gln) amidotransferase subunit GatC [Planctomycetaceae bacterium]
MDLEDVRKVASLARLELSPEELQTYGDQLTQILSYVEVLKEVDVENAEPMPHAIELQNVFRDDVRRDSLDRTEALANAPKTDGRFFQVPAILDQKDA